MKLVMSADLVLNHYTLEFMCEICEAIYRSIDFNDKKKLSPGNKQETNISQTNMDNYRITFDEGKTRCTISFGDTFNLVIDDKEFVELFYVFLRHKVVFIPFIFIIVFSEFIKSTSNIFVKNNIDSCLLLWPKEYSSTIERILNIPPKWTEKLVYQSFSILKDINNGTNVFSEMGFTFTLQYFAQTIVMEKDSSKKIMLLDFLSRRISSIQKSLLLKDKEGECLATIKYSFQSTDKINCYDFLLTHPIYYLVEDNNKELDEILTVNRKAQGLSTDSNEIYSWDLIYVYKFIRKTFPKYDENAITNTYSLRFTESIDALLHSKLVELLNSDNSNNYLYIICNDTFINREIVHFVERRYSNDGVFQTHFPNIDLAELRKEAVIFIYNFSELNNSEQRKHWKNLFNSENINKKKIFIDTKQIDNPMIDFNTSNIWIYQEEMIDNNLSKIFHALILENNIDFMVTDEIKYLIEMNKFNVLIKTDNFEYDLSLLSRAIFDIGKFEFNYSSTMSWYRFRQIYEYNLNEQYKRLSDKQTMKATKKIIFTKVANKMEIVLNGTVITEKFRKTTMYLVLAIDYYQKKNRFISCKHLVEIIDFYFKKNDIKDKILQENTPKSAKNTLESAFFKKGGANLDKRLKRFIESNICLKHGNVEYSDFDLNNEFIKYKVEFSKEFNIEDRLYETSYRLFLENFYR